jgi:hypothetical protein
MQQIAETPHAELEEPVAPPPVYDPKTNTYLHCDGVIEYLDGRMEFNGLMFDPPDWDEIDPPEGHPDAVGIPHDEVMKRLRESLGLPPRSV